MLFLFTDFQTFKNNVRIWKLQSENSRINPLFSSGFRKNPIPNPPKNSVYCQAYQRQGESYQQSLKQLFGYPVYSLKSRAKSISARLDLFFYYGCATNLYYCPCYREGDEHFNEESMRMRNPLLYDQLIRKYQTQVQN